MGMQVGSGTQFAELPPEVERDLGGGRPAYELGT